MRTDGKVAFHKSDLHPCGSGSLSINHCMVRGLKFLSASRVSYISLLLGKAAGQGCRLG